MYLNEVYCFFKNHCHIWFGDSIKFNTIVTLSPLQILVPSHVDSFGTEVYIYIGILLVIPLKTILHFLSSHTFPYSLNAGDFDFVFIEKIEEIKTDPFIFLWTNLYMYLHSYILLFHLLPIIKSVEMFPTENK